MHDRTSKVRKRHNIGAVAILTLSLLLTALSRGGETSVHHFDIAAQTLSSALNEFARQSQQQILFAPDVAAQKLSSPIRGDMQPIPALKLLLKDSGLTFKTTPSGAILVGTPRESRVAPANGPESEVPLGVQPSNFNADVETITVQGEREKEVLRRQMQHFLSSITAESYGLTLARWRKQNPFCPLVAGLPRDDGEYILKRLSQIAASVGAPVASQHCKPNFYVIVTAEPDALIKAWSNRDPWMFDDYADEGATRIHRFLKASTPVRAWYNIALSSVDGAPIDWHFNRLSSDGNVGDLRVRGMAQRDLWSIIVMVDANHTQGIRYGQLAAYIAMAGLSHIRLDAKPDDAPTILQLFFNSKKAPPLGLSAWDQAYLKGLYSTEPSDTQGLAIARSMEQEIAP